MGRIKIPLEIEPSIVEEAKQREMFCAALTMFDPRTRDIAVYVGLVSPAFASEQKERLEKKGWKTGHQGSFTADDE